MFDRNGSGTLDKKELEAALGQVAKLSGQKVPSSTVIKIVLRVVDKDGSGDVSLAEFRSMVDKLNALNKD